MAKPLLDCLRDEKASFVLLHTEKSLQPLLVVRMLHVYQSTGFFAPFGGAKVAPMLGCCTGSTTEKLCIETPPLHQDLGSYPFAVIELLS